MLTEAFNNTDNQKFTLIADIGGTNARFGLVGDDGAIYGERELLSKDYETFAEAVAHYFSLVEHRAEDAVIAFPGPVEKGQDIVKMTNGAHWEFSIKDSAQKLGLSALTVVNDYVPQAYAAFAYSPSDYFQVVGAPIEHKSADIKISVIGPGTGLGTINAEREGGQIICIPAEGGHASMPYTTLADAQILDVMQQKGLTITAEKAVSGTGIYNLYDALCTMKGETPVLQTPKDVTDAAVKGNDPTAAEAIDRFYYFLGVVAGNQVLVTGAKQLYLGGGILPKMGEEAFRKSRFMEGFLGNREASHVGLLEAAQVCIVTHPDPGRFGLVEYIKAQRQKENAPALKAAAKKAAKRFTP